MLCLGRESESECLSKFCTLGAPVAPLSPDPAACSYFKLMTSDFKCVVNMALQSYLTFPVSPSPPPPLTSGRLIILCLTYTTSSSPSPQLVSCFLPEKKAAMTHHSTIKLQPACVCTHYLFPLIKTHVPVPGKAIFLP